MDNNKINVFSANYKYFQDNHKNLNEVFLCYDLQVINVLTSRGEFKYHLIWIYLTLLRGGYIFYILQHFFGCNDIILFLIEIYLLKSVQNLNMAFEEENK